jgi:hypothetical protein
MPNNGAKATEIVGCVVELVAIEMNYAAQMLATKMAVAGVRPVENGMIAVVLVAERMRNVAFREVESVNVLVMACVTFLVAESATVLSTSHTNVCVPSYHSRVRGAHTGMYSSLAFGYVIERVIVLVAESLTTFGVQTMESATVLVVVVSVTTSAVCGFESHVQPHLYS